MNQSKIAKAHFIDLAVRGGDMGREDCQEGWHRLVAGLPDLGSVLDVGAGLGWSKSRIPNCTTYDPAPLPNIDRHGSLEDVLKWTYRTVTAFDVIEHVVEDLAFLRQLARISYRWLFITTPNEDVSHAANGCHCREYTPAEFVALLKPLGHLRLWHGDGKGLYPMEVSEERFLTHNNAHHAALVDLASPRVGR